MQHDLRKYLWDIEDLIEDIQIFAQGKGFAEYANDRFLRAAVERKFEVIGEAIVRIARHFPEHVDRLEGYRRFIGFRNILAHQYDAIDDTNVWRGVEASLPELKRQVKPCVKNSIWPIRWMQRSRTSFRSVNAG